MTDKAAKPPLLWGLTAIALISGGLGGGCAVAAGYGGQSVGAAIAALLVVAAAVISPREMLWKAGLVSATATFLMLLLAHTTGGHPIAAGISMALVAFVGALLAAGGSGFSFAGSLLSLAYFVPAAALRVSNGLSLSRAIELGLIGIAAGLVIVGVVVVLRALRGSPPDKPEEQSVPTDAKISPRAAIGESLRQRDNTFRYATRRALALGVAMGIFQINSNQNVFWIMLTIFIVLGPDRASSWQKALKRSGGVIVGALVISGLSEVLPAEVIFGLAAFALLGGVLYLQRNYTVWAAGITFVVLTLFGAQDHDFIIWAERRVVDTLIGAAIALAVGYFVLPERKLKREL